MPRWTCRSGGPARFGGGWPRPRGVRRPPPDSSWDWGRSARAWGFTSTSHVFVMEWAAILKDLVIGLLIAGAIAAWVPDSFWRTFFLADHPLAAKIWGPLVGPLVAMVSFVCSIGNVPLAAVLWRGGVSFLGAVGVFFSDFVFFPPFVIFF